MAAIAHSPSFAKKVGVPQSVGKDFNKADKGRKFSKGGEIMATQKDRIATDAERAKSRSFSGYAADRVLGRADFSKDTSSKEAVTAPLGNDAVMKRREAEAGLKKGGTVMASKMNPGFMAMMAKKKGADKMGAFEKSSKDTEKKGMKEGSKSEMMMDKKQMMGMKKGGATKMAKGGGIESKGKTKGTMIAMKKGGKC
jgi:hypothetical protein